MTGAVPQAATRRWLPWIVALALFMQQLDSTIVNTSIPAMAASLSTTPLALKAVSTSYVMALGVSIPVSGWLADRYGTRRVFLGAIALFTLASVACGLAQSVTQLVAARIPQGIAAAMMMPVGRSAIVRTFARSELLRAMNFVIIPALLGPLLGPTVGGLIVHWATWRDIFFVNVPFGLAALAFGWRHMPDYRKGGRAPFDLRGFALFGGGTALLSWLLEVFGEHAMPLRDALAALALVVLLLAGYGWHARRTAHPLLELRLLRIRTFGVSVLGGFVARLGMSGMPLLLPLLYQLGMRMPAWQAGLLMMPSALAAIGMKFVIGHVLARWGYRRVLAANTVCVGLTIAGFALVGPVTPVAAIVALALALGLFNSLQFTSMNTLAFADVDDADAAMASTFASTMQQLSMSFAMAVGSLVAAYWLGGASQADPSAVVTALHRAFLTLACVTLVSALVFRTLREGDGANVAGRAAGGG